MATRKRSNGHGNGNGRAQEREQRELECKLTDAEFQSRSDEMADCELEIEKLKEQRKGVNGAIAAAAAQRQKLAHVIDTRVEVRMVECAWVEDFQRNVKRLVRQDTGVEVDTRAMTADDRQGELALPPVDAPVPPAAPAIAPVTELAKRRGRPKKSTTPTDENTLHAH